MNASFFLGANSGTGFYSLYDEFVESSGGFFYLIKGGAGCGKSSFMQKIASEAEKRGFAVEYIFCSGDPDSLDGIYISELDTGFLDATAPHITEPRLFGVDSCYVNLGKFCSRAYSEKLSEYRKKYKDMYSVAYSYLSAAEKLRKVQIPGLITAKEESIARKRALSAVGREMGRQSCSIKHSNIKKRFIRCISCRGQLCLNDSINMLCKRTYLLDDRFGLADVYLSEIAKQRGFDLIICPNPLCPDELDAVLFPELSLGFISASVMTVQNPYRHIRLDALIPSEKLKSHKHDIKNREKLCSQLLDSAVYYLEKAKEYHDLLEAEYRPYIDFDALNSFTDDFNNKLFT